MAMKRAKTVLSPRRRRHVMDVSSRQCPRLSSTMKEALRELGYQAPALKEGLPLAIVFEQRVAKTAGRKAKKAARRARRK
jgi:hypothetical protein